MKKMNNRVNQDQKKESRSRSEKFKKLSEDRLENARWRIKSIGKLSNRSNYAYDEKQVEKIFSTLMFELKTAIAKFGSGNVEDRFRRYFEIDFKQLSALEETDPELYDFFLKKFDQLGPEGIIKEHIEEVRERERDNNNMISITRQLDDYNLIIRQLKNTVNRIETKIEEMDGYIKELGSTVLMDEQIGRLKKEFDK